MTKRLTVSKKNMIDLFKRYKIAESGIAAIEFVFVAPIMIGMYFGLAEISTAISQDRQISHSTNVAGDLTTQEATINAESMAEIMTAAALIMGVPTSRLNSINMELASFSRDSSNNVVPLGTATLGGSYPTAFDANDLDQLILSQSSGVVVARVSYDYEPLKLRFMTTNFTMSETFLLKPRQSANIDFLNASGDIVDFNCGFQSGKKVSCTAG